MVFSLLLDCTQSPTVQQGWGPLGQPGCNRSALLLSREALAEMTMTHSPGLGLASIPFAPSPLRLAAARHSSPLKTSFPRKPSKSADVQPSARGVCCEGRLGTGRGWDSRSGVRVDTDLPYLRTPRRDAQASQAPLDQRKGTKENGQA